MTTIKYINFRFSVNGVQVSYEYGLRRMAKKAAAEVRLSMMRQAKAFRILSQRQGW